VTNGPLPPHERPWRHPSELAAPAPEPTSRSGRVLILSTAAFGLLLVGALVVTMTPARSRNTETALDAIAVASTERSVAVGGATPSLADRSLAGDPAAEPRTAVTEGEEPVPPAGTTEVVGTGLQRPVDTSTAPATLTGAGATARPPVPTAPGTALGHEAGAAPIVTPIAEGLGVTTAAALDAQRSTAGHLHGVLPSGTAVEVDVLIKNGELLLVTFATPWDDATPVMPSAAPDDRGDDLFVLVDGAAVPVGSDRLDEVALEGAPVVDGSGSLIALYSGGDDGSGLIYVPQTPLLPGDTLVGGPPLSEPSTPGSTPSDTAGSGPPTTHDSTTGDSTTTAPPTPTTTAGSDTTTTVGTNPAPTEPGSTDTDPTEPGGGPNAGATSEPAVTDTSEPPASSEPPSSAPPTTG
jgi:hypothetical protein